MMNVVQLAVSSSDCRHMCPAGDVALNSKAIGAILRIAVMDDVFVQPAAAADGAAIEAELFPYYSGATAPNPP